ncbi:MAG: hypothetical protein FJX32_09940 [Alphaproteobacteria bacterium]|nr:hypothetical protein [Alphaproteobacteria bacterium]
MTFDPFRPALLPIMLLASLMPMIAACQMDSRQQVLATSNTQAAQRAISTRSFDTGDQPRVFQATIAALQDLGFVVDRADAVLGTVSATRYGGNLIRLTVSLRQISPRQTVVRASGQINQVALSDPEPFQRFFEALSQALYLAANPIE